MRLGYSAFSIGLSLNVSVNIFIWTVTGISENEDNLGSAKYLSFLIKLTI